MVNYGGRITDDKDMRTSDIIIAGFYNPEILSKDFAFSRSGRCYMIPTAQPFVESPRGYMTLVRHDVHKP